MSIKNTDSLHVYHRFDKGISKTVCAFLNTSGGNIWFTKMNDLYSEQEAQALINRIKRHLSTDISDYSDSLVTYELCEIKDDCFLNITVAKSNAFHQVISSSNYYVRKGKENAVISLEERFGVKKRIPYDGGYNKIGNFANGAKFYKYMSLENALMCLKNGNLWFVEPPVWEDKYEQDFYLATIKGNKCSPNNPIAYATCLTNTKRSEAAWKIYAYEKQGLASRCVQFVINRAKLRKALINANYKDTRGLQPLKNDYDIYEGVVSYLDETIIKELPKKQITRNGKRVQNRLHHIYFDTFTFEKYLNLLLLKRTAFQHENETRLFLVKKNFSSGKKGKTHLDVEIPWKDILEGVYYDSKLSDFEKQLLEDQVRSTLGLAPGSSFPRGFEIKKYNVYGTKKSIRIP